jgi:hypothetical protein
LSSGCSPTRGARAAGEVDHTGGSAGGWLTEQGGGPSWRVEVAVLPLMLDEQGHLPMLDIGRDALDQRGWDAVVLITDLPRRADTRPLLADYSTTVSAAWCRCPPSVRSTFAGARGKRSATW